MTAAPWERFTSARIPPQPSLNLPQMSCCTGSKGCLWMSSIVITWSLAGHLYYISSHIHIYLFCSSSYFCCLISLCEFPLHFLPALSFIFAFLRIYPYLPCVTCDNLPLSIFTLCAYHKPDLRAWIHHQIIIGKTLLRILTLLPSHSESFSLFSINKTFVVMSGIIVLLNFHLS